MDLNRSKIWMKENKNLPADAVRYLTKNSFKNYNVVIDEKVLFKTIIVIPAIDEFENIKKLLLSLSQNDSDYFDLTLILFVINNTSAALSKVKENNYKSLRLLQNLVNHTVKDNPFISKIINSGLHIAFIDASTQGNELPAKDGGVGLARKIGMDAALSLFDYSNGNSNMIVCLDADCIVEQNYITTINKEFRESNSAVAYINFEHLLDGTDENIAAIICYEIFLRYYVLGLKFASSPYAFYTIGSTIICSAQSYIKIGGMNKRKAAEDFYFMEKLAKNFKIDNIYKTTVCPSNRASWRVPFGTGQRIKRFLSNERNEYRLYSPDSFRVLKDWLAVFNSGEIFSAEYYLNASKNINVELYNFLMKNNFKEWWGSIIEHSKFKRQINKQKNFWFDGFKTLKLIHHLCDNIFMDENMFDALDKMFRLMDIPEPQRDADLAVPSIEKQLEYLNILKKYA